MTVITDHFRHAVDDMTARVHGVGDDQWHRPTPCADWDVRELVNHVTVENLWVPPLLAGLAVADLGDVLAGDVLGADPVAAWDAAAHKAVDAFAAPSAADRTVHLSFGDVPGAEYAGELVADMVIHSWDVAHATGGDERLDPELVDVVAAWFAGNEEAYRSGGLIGPHLPTRPGADRQTRLLAAFGRQG
ncbi:TIGR03086 family metal-binding protein [Actinomadura sp. NPDC047616]|uniref:TIGR03086 family metal-binding protein n=1 Tax=Actinomadura sp. NPDC047616 TaxID=3155914 RepID=UPI0033ED4F5A